MTRRYALRDDQWEIIKDLLPGREGYVGVTAKDNRLFVEGMGGSVTVESKLGEGSMFTISLPTYSSSI